MAKRGGNEALDPNIESLSLAAAFLSGMSLALCIVLLTLIVRLNRRVRSLEAWLGREFGSIHDGMNHLHRLIMEAAQRGITAGSSGSIAPNTTALPMTRQEQDIQPYYPATPQASPFAPPRRPASQPPDRFLPAGAKDIVTAVNKLLLSSQPFNFQETLQDTHPRLTLMRMSPRGTPDLWSSAIILDPGGDGYFALIDQHRAYLFPNYDRFSTAHDPKLLFDGARMDARVHAVIHPAILVRSNDGAWQLSEKGQIQMR